MAVKSPLWARKRYVAQVKKAVASVRRPRAKKTRNARTGGFLGIELKFLDCAWNGVTLQESTDGSGGELQPSSGCTNALSVPAQGDGESNRDGRKYTIKSVYCSGHLNFTSLQNEATINTSSGCFLALVLDTQANGATIATENVFVNPSTLAAAMLPQPLRNLQNSKRFRVLASTTVFPQGTYAGTDGASVLSVATQVSPTFSLSWKGDIVCDSVGTTADVASASDNAIHLVGFTGDDYLQPTVVAKSRMRFVG